MFIINLKYVVPLEEIDRHMTAHMKFLNKYYKNNTFIASGRKVPRTGGIIIAVGKSKSEIEELVKEDPFHNLKLAEFEITEFQTSQMKKGLQQLIDSKS